MHSGCSLLWVVLPSCIVTAAAANPIPIPTLLMPEEFIDIEIVEHDGSLRARVDGGYPFANAGFESVAMLYPLAPASTHIEVWLDGAPLEWWWIRMTYPTVLPEWPAIPMIQWNINPVPDKFTITTHYEHGIVRRPSEFVFLYPMGTGKYLPTYAKLTTAHVKVSLPGRYLPRSVFRDTRPFPYALAADAPGWIVSAEVVSRMFEPLLEDFILTFIDRWADPNAWCSQPPDLADGLDVTSEEPGPIIADDFVVPADAPPHLTLGAIRWWGSFPGWEGSEPKPTTPRPPPDYFVLRVFEDITSPDPNGGGTGRPGPLVYQERIRRFDQSYFGAVVRVKASGSDESTYEYEHKFEYRAALARPLALQPGHRYWLSLSAGPVPCEWGWGWATSPVHEGGSALRGHESGDAGWTWAPIPTPGPSPLDAAFVLSALPRSAMRYRLVEGSTLTDACPLCDRPDIQVPLRGSFWLAPAGENPLYSDYEIRRLAFHGVQTAHAYQGRGHGTYRIGGEVAVVQEMKLAAEINGLKDLTLTSGLVPAQAPFPWIEIDVAQVLPADALHSFKLHLVAAPWPVLWFSTDRGLHPEAGGYVSDGDLVSGTGQVIRTNAQLTAGLGMMPPAPDIGLDGVGPPTGPQPSVTAGELWFSSEVDAFSESLGPLSRGDLLSSAGAIVRRNADLIAPFAAMPPVPDVGLDATCQGPGGQLLFSVETGFFSERLGLSIDDGDLLSEEGTVFRSHQQLMAAFEPVDPVPLQLGLDAAYAWPHGEVWFSTKSGFLDKRLGPVRDGDVLSDTGRVVWRNLELLSPFGPLEDLADFGLDALQVIWPVVPADFDGDADVDSADLGHFQECASGPQVPQTDPACLDADADGDGDVDQVDFGLFQRCMGSTGALMNDDCTF